MRRTLALALAVGAGALSVVSPALGDSTATVRIDANAFAPTETAVDPQGTVSWLVQEGGHTIVADDRRFDFRGEGGTTLPAGTTVSFTFGADEYVSYYCNIHGGPGGQGMAGRVRVGNPPAPPPHRQSVIRVPGDAPTLAAAVALTAPGHRIELGPGDHAVGEPVEVATHDVTIAGSDRTSRLVPTAAPSGFPATALHVTGSRARVEHLRIAAFRDSGIHLDGADNVELVDVHVDGAGFTQDGIVATGVRGATVRATTTARGRHAGIRIADCGACGVLIDGVEANDNEIGVLVEAAIGVTVRRSTVERNERGIVARASRSSFPLRPVTATILDNHIDRNTHTGVRVAGASDTLVARNSVTGGPNGIVVAGDWSRRTVVDNNVVDGRLAWDGAGRTVTFTDNRDGSGDRKEPTLDPTTALP